MQSDTVIPSPARPAQVVVSLGGRAEGDAGDAAKPRRHPEVARADADFQSTRATSPPGHSSDGGMKQENPSM
nr:hypothetical protein CFP56_03666 [Quercus suber]